ncbi:uncharacterized protein G6M90_00g032370 [Metarhizium brunneum]|uniref:Uncharacterized protein n=1 Tax=Metarhizium brunneum TaxID=500148 RepID=A0A7D5UVU9_9HYPO|nr:hypothetical protein G6M90_00g032370 [Metarhizium brunneum]
MKYTYLAFTTLASLALAAPQTTPVLTMADMGTITPQRVLEIAMGEDLLCKEEQRGRISCESFIRPNKDIPAKDGLSPLCQEKERDCECQINAGFKDRGSYTCTFDPFHQDLTEELIFSD